MRRSSPTSASGWPSASGWAWRAWAATPRTARATCSCAFATGNRGLSHRAGEDDPRAIIDVRMVVDEHINPLFEAVVEATEEAITNALLAAETMTGRDGITAHALDPDRLVEVMRAHAADRRLTRPTSDDVETECVQRRWCPATLRAPTLPIRPNLPPGERPARYRARGGAWPIVA